MSNFLDNLRNLETGDDSDNFQLIEVIRDAANNLGENARRMFEIGILQDELVKLGFSWFNELGLIYNPQNTKVEFYRKQAKWYVVINGVKFMSFRYCLNDSPTWQQDILTKIKELTDHE